MLSSEEATALLTGMDVSTVVGLCDRAIIAVDDLHLRACRCCRRARPRGLLRAEKTLVAPPPREKREALDALTDGIHSGLARPGTRGVFFYFQARPRNGARLHFWKYYDLKNDGIIDNRYLIANLIACDRDTPRVVDLDLFRSVFDLQEKVIASIVSSVEEQKAREAAPRTINPIQQPSRPQFKASYWAPHNILTKETVGSVATLAGAADRLSSP